MSKGDLDLGNSTGSGGNSGEVKLAEKMVVHGHGSFSLVNLDGDSRLVVGVSRKGLGLLGGNGGVPLDQAGHDSTGGLDSKGERSDVEEKKVGDGLAGVAGEDSSLNSGSVSDGLIGVDGAVELLSVEEVLEQLLDLGDPGGSADEDDVVDGALVHLGVSHGLLDRLKGSLEQVRTELLESGSGDGGVEVDALEERVDLDVGLCGGGESPLGALASGSQPSQSPLVALDVLLMLPLELVDEMVDHPVVEVLTSQVSVSGGGLDLEDALLNGQDGDVEGATAKIEDQDVALGGALLLVQTVSDGGRGRFVDDSKNVETGDDSGVLGSLPLRIVEVGWNGDHGVLDVGSPC